jgi:hypothetical protein
MCVVMCVMLMLGSCILRACGAGAVLRGLHCTAVHCTFLLCHLKEVCLVLVKNCYHIYFIKKSFR